MGQSNVEFVYVTGKNNFCYFFMDYSFSSAVNNLVNSRGQI